MADMTVVTSESTTAAKTVTTLTATTINVSAINATGAVSMTNVSLSLPNIPTATTGLATGAVWSNSGVLTLVQ